MRTSTVYEQVHTTDNGFKYVKLRTGRRYGFRDARQSADRALTNLWRAMARMGKLSREYDFDYSDWDEVERVVDQIQSLVDVWREQIAKHGVRQAKEARIKALRDVRGRLPEEAAAYLAKADQLEKELGS